jgi:hypothetical protein
VAGELFGSCREQAAARLVVVRDCVGRHPTPPSRYKRFLTAV